MKLNDQNWLLIDFINLCNFVFQLNSEFLQNELESSFHSYNDVIRLLSHGLHRKIFGATFLRPIVSNRAVFKNLAL